MNIKAPAQTTDPVRTVANVYTLSDGNLTVGVSDVGAELTSLRSEETGLEYLWQGDTNVWGRRSPVLFPIVGRLKDDTYTYEGKKYRMTQHGFARDMRFKPVRQSSASIAFKLRDDEKTLERYPFQWQLFIRYTLVNGRVAVAYEVTNRDKAKPLFFSIGGHPGFRCPLLPGERYEDYSLMFANEYSRLRHIHTDGLMTEELEPFLDKNHDMQLARDMFDRGAIIFRYPDVTSIKLLNKMTGNGVRLLTPYAPYLGIWGIRGADFICLEPWCGLPDSVDSNHKLEDKEGIRHLLPEGLFVMSYFIEPLQEDRAW